MGYISLLIEPASNYINTFYDFPNYEIKNYTIKVGPIICSGIICSLILILTLLKESMLTNIISSLTPVKLFMIVMLVVVGIANYLEMILNDDQLTRVIAPRGTILLFDIDDFFVVMAWTYCLLSANGIMPGIVSVLKNKNKTSVKVINDFHLWFLIFTVPLGVIMTLNFGIHAKKIYEIFETFDSAFHGVRPIWTMFVGKLFGMMPFFFLIASNPKN